MPARKSSFISLPLAAFSIGLGLAEVLAPKAVGKRAGLSHRSGLIRGYGVRELVAGGLILAAPKSPTPIWMRVAGDFIDLLTIAPATRRDHEREPGARRSALIAAAAVGAITVLDILAARSMRETA
jgi:hypothetical protein